MADDMEEVTQEFTADTTGYTADLDEATTTAEEFAVANEEAKTAADGLRDSAAEGAAAEAGLTDVLASVRDRLAEVAVSSTAVAEALGHLRDTALETSVAEKELGDSADTAATKLDLMGLSGASSYTGLVPLVGIIGAIVIAAAAVAPAVAAMGLGFGAFGVFAIPTIMQVTAGLGDTSAQLAKLPAPIRDVVQNVKNLEGAWKAASAAFQPEVLGAIDQALGIAGDLMKQIAPLAVQGGIAVGGMLSAIKAGIDSSGFAQFLRTMTSLVVPATQAITKLAMTVLSVLGNALEQLAPLSVPFINLVTQIVSALGGPAAAALKVVVGLIVGLGQAIEPLLPGLSKIATELITDIGGGFQSFLPIISQVVSILGGSLIKILQDLEPIIANALTPNSPFILALEQLPHVLNAIMPLITGFAGILANPAIANAAVWIISLVTAFKGLQGVVGLLSGAFSFITGLPGMIMGFVTAVRDSEIATKAWTAVQWLLDAAMDANPLGLIVIAVVALIAVIILIVTHLHAFASAFDVVRHAVAAAVDWILNWARANWPLIVGIFLGPVALIAAEIVQHWNTIKKDATEVIGDVINWFKANWKLILSILLDPIGTAVMEIRQHWTEIASAFDAGRHDVAAIVDGMVQDIASAFDTFRHDVAAVIDWFPQAIATAFDTARHDVAAIVDAIPGDIEKAWDTVRHDAAALGDDVLHALETAWDSVKSATSTAVSDVLSFFEKLPGQVTSFLAALPGQMLTIGENVIKGLINGIVAAAASIPSIMSGLASDVASYFTDPLKLFSPSRLFFDHGFNIVQGAINGVNANAPNLLATMRGLGTGVGAQGLGSSLAAGAIAPAGGSTSVHVSVPVTAQGMTPDYTSPQFTQYIQGVVQEGVLRYGQLNPGNGLSPAWGR